MIRVNSHSFAVDPPLAEHRNLNPEHSLQPLITIGITCYSEGDWLRECWESVLTQTDERWTAVLVMDGTSNARTRAIFEQLTHSKLRKLALPDNVGPYPTRNKAFELTGTPYHFYLDGDDQLLPDSVALVLDAFEKRPQAGFVYGDYELFGERQTVKRFKPAYTVENFVEGVKPPGACAYRKAVWERLGGFAEELARGPADYDFHIALREAGVEGCYIPRPFYRCRKGHSSVTSSYELQGARMHEIIARRHPDFFTTRQRDRFLALGYKQAAYANQLAGHHGEAKHLSRRAIRHGIWTNRRLWRMALLGGRELTATLGHARKPGRVRDNTLLS